MRPNAKNRSSEGSPDGVRAPPSNLLEETTGACAHVRPTSREALLPSVIGIVHPLPFPTIDMIEKQRQSRRPVTWGHPLEIGEIVAVQCHDVGEASEVGSTDLAGSVTRNVDPVSSRFADRPSIRWLAHVPGTRTGRIHLHVETHSSRFRSKGGFRQW